MKRLMTRMVLASVLAGSIWLPAIAQRGGGHSGSRSSYGGEHYTTGHTTKSGTYVQGHYSTNPNGTKNDNYSTRGNVNPHTGEAGTKPGDGQGY